MAKNVKPRKGADRCDISESSNESERTKEMSENLPVLAKRTRGKPFLRNSVFQSQKLVINEVHSSPQKSFMRDYASISDSN